MHVIVAGMSVALNHGMTEVHEIRDIDELAGYRLAWNSWLAESSRATFANTFDWLDTYWRHFGHDQQLRALVVRSAGATGTGRSVRIRRRRCSRQCSTFVTRRATGI
jgi:hypothetical protein